MPSSPQPRSVGNDVEREDLGRREQIDVEEDAEPERIASGDVLRVRREHEAEAAGRRIRRREGERRVADRRRVPFIT